MPGDKKRTVKSNDTVVSIAQKYGLRDWAVVWNANKDPLKRDHPFVLYKKDQDRSPEGKASKADEVTIRQISKKMQKQRPLS